MKTDLIQDQKKRCPWCLKDEQYVHYHDEEWGEVCHDDSTLFEFLLLETFQAGLSWHTILKKRENFRSAFNDKSQLCLSSVIHRPRPQGFIS